MSVEGVGAGYLLQQQHNVSCEIPSTPRFAWAPSHSVIDPLLIGCDEENFGAHGSRGVNLPLGGWVGWGWG